MRIDARRDDQQLRVASHLRAGTPVNLPACSSDEAYAHAASPADGHVASPRHPAVRARRPQPAHAALRITPNAARHAAGLAHHVVQQHVARAGRSTATANTSITRIGRQRRPAALPLSNQALQNGASRAGEQAQSPCSAATPSLRKFPAAVWRAATRSPMRTRPWVGRRLHQRRLDKATRPARASASYRGRASASRVGELARSARWVMSASGPIIR